MCYSIPMATTYQVEVTKSGAESSATLLRRFQRKVQEAAIVPKVRAKRYNERPKSKLAQKNSAVKKLVKRADFEKLKKLGKLKPKVFRKRG